jgi:hypothetical protein
VTDADALASHSVTARLDWVCIGAQKAGTSTLFRLLREHPRVQIPEVKEDPLFDRDVGPQEVQAYLSERFGGADPGAKCGTVTPQYMSSPLTAARVHASAPGAKIVVLLRDPVERAFSHYRMSVRRGLEARTFAEATRSQTSTLAGGSLPDPDSETETYVYRGCYGAILAPWYELFGSANVQVELTEDLETEPAAVTTRVQSFLGLPPVVTDGAGFRAHAAPPPHRLSGLRRPVAGALRRLGLLQLLPVERKEKLADAIERGLARVIPKANEGIDPGAAADLRAFYADDVAWAAALVRRALPWAT